MKKDFKYFIQGPASFVVKAEEHFGCAEIAITLDRKRKNITGDQRTSGDR